MLVGEGGTAGGWRCWEDLPEKVSFEERPKGNKEPARNFWGKNILGKWTNMCKGPEAGVALEHQGAAGRQRAVGGQRGSG